MSWKNIDIAPRNGTIIQVRSDDWPEPYWVRYWTKDMLEEEEWEGFEHGWYEYFPKTDQDGDDLLSPEMWFDNSQ